MIHALRFAPRRRSHRSFGQFDLRLALKRLAFLKRIAQLGPISLAAVLIAIGWALAVELDSVLLGVMAASLAFLIAVSIYISVAGPPANRRS